MTENPVNGWRPSDRVSYGFYTELFMVEFRQILFSQTLVGVIIIVTIFIVINLEAEEPCTLFESQAGQLLKDMSFYLTE